MKSFFLFFLLIEEINLRPELSGAPDFRIQGESPEHDKVQSPNEVWKSSFLVKEI